jgi:hypothetical protein
MQGRKRLKQDNTFWPYHFLAALYHQWQVGRNGRLCCSQTSMLGKQCPSQSSSSRSCRHSQFACSQQRNQCNQEASKGTIRKILWKTEHDSLLCDEIVTLLTDINNLGFRLALGQDQLQSLCSTAKKWTGR